jgi:N6-adenosine-specific RNA methylase IME4
MLTWVKDRMRIGKWLRDHTEHCMLAVRGRPVFVKGNHATILERPEASIREPEEFYALVEERSPQFGRSSFCGSSGRDGQIRKLADDANGPTCWLEF